MAHQTQIAISIGIIFETDSVWGGNGGFITNSNSKLKAATPLQPLFGGLVLKRDWELRIPFLHFRMTDCKGHIHWGHLEIGIDSCFCGRRNQKTTPTLREAPAQRQENGTGSWKFDAAARA